MGASPTLYHACQFAAVRYSTRDLVRGQFSYSHFGISEFTKDNVYSYRCIYVLVTGTRPQGTGCKTFKTIKKFAKRGSRQCHYLMVLLPLAVSRQGRRSIRCILREVELGRSRRNVKSQHGRNPITWIMRTSTMQSNCATRFPTPYASG